MKFTKSQHENLKNDTLFQSMTFLSSDTYEPINANIINRLISFFFPHKETLKATPAYIQDTSHHLFKK